jgi:hypothetical protein
MTATSWTSWLQCRLAEPVANVWKLVALYAVSAVVGIYHIITANKEKIPGRWGGAVVVDHMDTAAAICLLI